MKGDISFPCRNHQTYVHKKRKTKQGKKMFYYVKNKIMHSLYDVFSHYNRGSSSWTDQKTYYAVEAVKKTP